MPPADRPSRRRPPRAAADAPPPAGPPAADDATLPGAPAPPAAKPRARRGRRGAASAVSLDADLADLTEPSPAPAHPPDATDPAPLPPTLASSAADAPDVAPAPASVHPPIAPAVAAPAPVDAAAGAADARRGDAGDPRRRRDPVVVGGLAALAVGTVLAGLLYSSAPQSAAEIGSRAMVVVAPDAFTPHVTRARERVAAAQQARATGDTAAALARYAEAEAEALTARDRAPDAAEKGTATELWAGAVLDRAELMLASGSHPWYRADDDTVLNDALKAVQRVEEAPVAAATKQRAAGLDARIRQALRPGPLEWLPR